MQAFDATPPPLTADENGVIRVTGTRVQLEVIVEDFRCGATPEEIIQHYTTLDLAKVYAVIAYVLDHPDFIDSYMVRRRQEADEVRRQTEAKYPPEGVRARLLARRKSAAER